MFHHIPYVTSLTKLEPYCVRLRQPQNWTRWTVDPIYRYIDLMWHRSNNITGIDIAFIDHQLYLFQSDDQV